MVTHYFVPEFKTTITHSATNYQLEDIHTDCQVILNENAVNELSLTATDTDGEVFINKADINDQIKVEVRFSDKTSTWRQLFGGYVTELAPTATTENTVLILKARGYEQALLAMPVCQEYGTQSAHPTLNTIQEIITDASYGIIDKYVEKVLNSALSSGYTIDSTKVANFSSDFKYIYWAYKPALRCLDDLIDLGTAYSVSNTGPHWIAYYSGTTCYLCLATVGNHENPPSDVWPTWWNTDQAGSTIEVSKDIVTSAFTKLKPEANYILYHGKLRKPGDGDFWTENQKGLWLAGTDTTLTDDNTAGNYKVGSYSLKADSAATKLMEMYYPSAKNASWDMTKWGGKYNIPNVTFWAKRSTNADGLYFCLCNDGSNYFYKVLHSGSGMTAAAWYNFTYSIGPYCYIDGSTTPWSQVGSPVWTDIDYILFYATSSPGGAGSIWIDGLCFNGHVIRGAYDSTKMSNQNAVLKLIIDDVAKDDSGVASDDAYTMAQMAKAELYKSVTTPLTGEIVVPGLETIMAGQLAHIHASQTATGYNINKDMRITRAIHRIAPEPHNYRTYLSLTDDVKNGKVMQPHKGYNLLLDASNPNFQNRERASFKSRDIDITQALLNNPYVT